MLFDQRPARRRVIEQTMGRGFHLWPDQASSFAPKVDALYVFLLAVAAFFTLLICGFIVYFALRYRRRPGRVAVPVKTSPSLELAWTAIPFLLTLVLFGWGAQLFVHMQSVPEDALQIHVVAKQWMWKLQHPNGKREINELHVPLGSPVRLTMGSQDVIHSFFVPAFRLKQDVVPGRYTSLWFRATAVGEYHLFCAEYCGDQHSGMIGKVVVMEPEKYQSWLSGTPPNQSPVAAGEKLFTQHACITCHGQRGPGLVGLYNSRQTVIENGREREVVADENYIRESILAPSAKLVKGFPPLMPTFAGQLSEEQVLDLVAYIKSLRLPATNQSPATAGDDNAASDGPHVPPR
jgi:cytochrome c oxidase subunit 2